MCSECLQDNKRYTTTTFTVEYGNSIIVIRNVPCLECEFCGETFFADQVSAKLESLVNTAKSLMQEVSIIDYEKVA